MTEERRIQLVAEVDTTGTREGFNQISQQAGQMAREVSQAGEQAQRGAAGVGAGANTSSRNVEAASRSIIGSIQRTTAAMEAGGRQTAAYYELLARQRGVDPSTLNPYLSGLRAVEQAQVRTGQSSAQVANAMRMVPAQLTDIATQLAGGQSPMLIMMQQGGQLRDMFGSIPAAARGVGSSIMSLINPYSLAAVAAGVLAVAYNQGSKEADGYSKAIIMTGNAAGTSRNQLADYAQQMSQVVGTQGKAAEVLTELASTGKVGSENMKQFGLVAVQVQKYLGRSIEGTVKDFAELGKSPVEASLKLSESYHYLTSAVYEQIKALQDQGKNDEAAEVAQKAYADAFAGRAAKMKESLGSIDRAWIDVKESAAKAWDVFLGVGRKKTPAQELAEVQAQIALAQTPPSTSGTSRSDGEEMRRAIAASNLTKLLAQETTLKAKIAKDALIAQQEAIGEQIRQASLEWDKIMDSTLTKALREQKEIARVTQMGLDAGASDEQIKKAVNKVKQDFAALNNPILAQLEGNREVQREILAGQTQDLESSYKRQLISETEYLSKKRDLQVKELDLEVGIVQARAKLDKGKEDQSAYQKDISDLQVLVQRRINIITGADNAIKDADAARARAVDDLVGGWDRQIEAEKNAAAQELALFGQSVQARQIYIAQLKIEEEQQKFIAARAKEGHALTEQEIADLSRRTEARKNSLAEVRNERAALAAAEQLLRENEKFSASYIADDELRARRITEIDSKQWAELIRNTEEGSEARKKLLTQFDQWYANRTMAPVLDRWKGVIDGLDNDFREGFRDMLESGKSAWPAFTKSLGNTLKSSLADSLYQVFAKKYVVQFVTGLAGAMSGPAVASALNGNPISTGGAMGAISAAQMASNLYSFASGGMTLSGGIGTGFMGSLAGGLNGAGVGAGLESSLGLSIGSSISSVVGPTVSSAIASGLGAVATALPWIGAATAAFALGKAAFGMGDKQVTSTGLRGSLSAMGLTGESYSNWHQNGGWFRSDRNGTDTSAFSADITKQFTQGFQSIEEAAAKFAQSIGASTDSLTGYSKTFDIALGSDQAANQKAISDFFAGVSDEVAKRLVPNLDDFTKSGETASAALQRLAGDFDATNQMAQLLGKSAVSVFGSLGMDSASARERLVSLFGDTGTLGQLASSYAQNFLTDAERLKPVQEALDAAMKSLGLSSVTTREEFKKVVDSLDLTTDAGAKEFVSLMKLSDAFARVHPEIQSTADALQAMKDAASGLLGDVDNAYSVLQKVADREKAAIQTTVDAQAAAVSHLTDLSQALHSALDSYKTPEQKAYDRAAAQAEIRADLAIMKAGGVLSDFQTDSLKKALGNATQDARGQFSSYTDYLRDLYRTQNDLAALGEVTDDQLSVEQKALKAAQDQLKAIDDMLATEQQALDKLKGIDTNGLTLIQAMEALRGAILSAQANPIVAATQAINEQYQKSLGRAPDAAGLAWWQGQAAKGAPISDIQNGIASGAEGTIRGLYQLMLGGRDPSTPELNYWLGQANKGVSLATITDAIANSDESKRLMGIPGFATGGDFLGGLRIVGERGPELEATGPARIFNASQTANMLTRLSSATADNRELVQELRGLKDEMIPALQRIASFTNRTAVSNEYLERSQRYTDEATA